MTCLSCCTRLARSNACPNGLVKQMTSATTMSFSSSPFSTVASVSRLSTVSRHILSTSSLSTIPKRTQILSLSITRPLLPSTSPNLAQIKPDSHRAFSTTTPALAPRNTYNPSHRVRKRRHGFLSRIRTRKGRNILMRRRQKGRQNLSH